MRTTAIGVVMEMINEEEPWRQSFIDLLSNKSLIEDKTLSFFTLIEWLASF